MPATICQALVLSVVLLCENEEILRPAFELNAKPLSKVCGFILISNTACKTEGIQNRGLASA
jgi:hypothetical protein